MNENKKVVIAGGNGFLGKLLINSFLKKGCNVINLNRHQSREEGRLKEVKWDGKSLTSWIDEINGSFAVINLVGRSVDCRYNEKNKKEILNSRIVSTEAIGKAIQMANQAPKLWVNASSTTIYKHSLDKEMDEVNGDIGNGFSVDICTNWEKVVREYQTDSTRQVLLRTSMVMGIDGGVFPVLSKLVKRGLGGRQGRGNQYMSWIHDEDFIRAIDWIIANPQLEGAINCTAPIPIRNKEFMQIMREGWKIPFGLNAPKWMLEIGAIFLRTETELILKSRRVVPKKLLQSGFQFNYLTATEAIQHLIHQKQSNHEK